MRPSATAHLETHADYASTEGKSRMRKSQPGHQPGSEKKNGLFCSYCGQALSCKFLQSIAKQFNRATMRNSGSSVWYACCDRFTENSSKLLFSTSPNYDHYRTGPTPHLTKYPYPNPNADPKTKTFIKWHFWKCNIQIWRTYLWPFVGFPSVWCVCHGAGLQRERTDTPLDSSGNMLTHWIQLSLIHSPLGVNVFH